MTLRLQIQNMRRAFILIFIFSFLLPGFVNSQPANNCKLRISVLTCGPGNELYSLFGHSALRITDSLRGTDIIYNWGTFDFNEPGFYLKFMRGKLLYFVSPDQVRLFLEAYQYEGRSVQEQVLALTCEEKQLIINAVNLNMQGDNVFYKYDFLFDNCTTRIRDLLFNHVKNIEITSKLVPPGTTFRNMLHAYLDSGNHPWSKLGIDILLGAKIDRQVTNFEAMFLPDYLMKGIDASKISGKPVVAKKILILPATDTLKQENTYLPLIYISVVCAIILLIGFLPFSFAQSITRFIDSFLIYITGILGLLLVFMWFFTDHISCENNYNLLWAMPFNIIAGFLIFKKTIWIKRYFLINAAIIFLMLVLWKLLPQQFNIALVPLLLLLFYKYLKIGLGK